LKSWPLYILDEHLRDIREDRDEVLKRILLTATYRLNHNTNGGIKTQRIQARKVGVPLEKKDWDLCDWTYGRWSSQSARLAQIMASFEVLRQKVDSP